MYILFEYLITRKPDANQSPNILDVMLSCKLPCKIGPVDLVGLTKRVVELNFENVLYCVISKKHLVEMIQRLNATHSFVIENIYPNLDKKLVVYTFVQYYKLAMRERSLFVSIPDRSLDRSLTSNLSESNLLFNKFLFK